MRIRVREIIFILICLAMLVFGAILLIYADETPAPGLLLIAGAVVALIWHYMPNNDPAAADLLFEEKGPIERDREIYEQQAERRRRGESDDI